MGRFSLRRIATKPHNQIMKLLAHFALAGAATAALTADYEWQAWKNQHKVSFPAHEEASRYEIFVASRNFVKEHNLRAAHGLETYTVGLNKFAAMSEEEFEVQYLNTKMQDPAVKLVLEWNCEARCTPTLVTATPLSSLGPTADRDMLEKPGSPPSKTRALAAPAGPLPPPPPSRPPCARTATKTAILGTAWLPSN